MVVLMARSRFPLRRLAGLSPSRRTGTLRPHHPPLGKSGRRISFKLKVATDELSYPHHLRDLAHRAPPGPREPTKASRFPLRSLRLCENILTPFTYVATEGLFPWQLARCLQIAADREYEPSPLGMQSASWPVRRAAGEAKS
jgi:hypothetical protein